jgi:hypothetical protein
VRGRGDCRRDKAIGQELANLMLFGRSQGEGTLDIETKLHLLVDLTIELQNGFGHGVT